MTAALSGAGGLILVQAPSDLAAAVAPLLADPAAAKAMGRARPARGGRGRRRAGTPVGRAAAPDTLPVALPGALPGAEAGRAMKLNTPRWWYVRDSNHARMTRTVLKPLGWLWAGVTARRIARAAPVDPGCAVVSVGNLTVGGSGKTPVAREILRLLRAADVEAQGLSRGYGGRLEGPVRVDPAAHTADDVGDEPLMLAQGSPVWIARDRVAGARAAVADGALALVLDDGHQNPALKKTVSLIVVDGETRGDEWPFGGRIGLSFRPDARAC